MYDSMTKHNFDRVSDAVDRVSDAVDSDLDKADTNSIKPTYDNASDTNTGSTKYDQNTKGAPKDTDTKDKVQNDRYDNTVTQVKWSTETNKIDNQYFEIMTICIDRWKTTKMMNIIKHRDKYIVL